jgi:hypothetical protein
MRHLVEQVNDVYHAGVSPAAPGETSARTAFIIPR